MEERTSFKGFIGTPEEVANFNIESNRYVETLDQFHIDAIKAGYITGLNIKSKEGIIIPRLFAVYQDCEPVLNNKWLDYSKIRKNLRYNKHEDGIQAKKHLFLKECIVDELPTNLISVAYDPAVWERDLVAASLNDKTGRIKIVKLSDLPEFYKKDTEILSLLNQRLDQLKTIRGKNNRSFAYRAVTNSVKETIEKLEEQLNNYGLTSEEYVTINVVKPTNFKPPSILETTILEIFDFIAREIK